MLVDRSQVKSEIVGDRLLGNILDAVQDEYLLRGFGQRLDRGPEHRNTLPRRGDPERIERVDARAAFASDSVGEMPAHKVVSGAIRYKIRRNPEDIRGTCFLDVRLRPHQPNKNLLGHVLGLGQTCDPTRKKGDQRRPEFPG
ncbi:hypothetical protein GGC65_001652 [Sphingopyxis sp. OAS728]|nr:hypothetical protein [Sphingopyxis sp. OAS728]MBE1527196.1 hypothetical protein [Sphingopyxis sp. OAS728]